MSTLTNAGFIIPTRRFVDVGMPAVGMTTKGRYMLIKRDALGAEIERTPWFDNIILDSGLNRWGTGGVIAGAAIGTDNTAPAASQTGLLAQTTYTTGAGTGNGTSSALGSSPYNNTYTAVYRTVLGQLNGNYYEVGCGWASGSMFSRALILTGGGSPTSISVTSVQQLDIVYQLSVYPPLTDTGPTTITISGVNYDVTGRACEVSSLSGGGGPSWNPSQATSAIAGTTSLNGLPSTYTGTLGAITASPSGTAGGTAATITTNAYSNNSLQRTAYASYSLTQGNVSGGIKSTRFWWGVLAGFQYEFDPVIPKDSTKTLVLNYSITWARR